MVHMKDNLKAPFPWFGGKRKVAPEVWRRFGTVQNYVEPFFGSGAVMLNRPQPFSGNETINDFDGFVANFWRSLRLSPDETAEWADQQVNENDLHARHVWLVERRETLRAHLEGDPDYHDPKIAGWWVWGLACWIGSGFCSGKGPWWIDEHRKLVHLGDNGRGVNRQLVHLSNNGRGVNRQLVHLGDNGRGVNRQLVHLGDNGRGVNRLSEWFGDLSARLRNVRVASGDWSRVCGPSVTFKHGMTGVFLDPPYSDGKIDYIAGSRCSDGVREWAVANGDNPLLRIALCGYEGEHEMPPAWSVHEWNAGAGFGGQAEERTGNGRQERIWFSPACLSASQASLF